MSARPDAEIIGWYSNDGKSQLWMSTGATNAVQTCQAMINDNRIAINPGLRDSDGDTGNWQHSSGRPKSFHDRNSDVHFITVRR